MFLLLYGLTWYAFSERRFESELIVLAILLVAPMVITVLRDQRLKDLGITMTGLSRGIIVGLVSGLALVAIHKTFWPAEYYGFFPNLTIGVIIWIIVAFAQEMFFRGYIQSRLMNATGRYMGIILASLLFALWHTAISAEFLILPQFGRLFFAGLIWGISFMYTKNLAAPFVSHFFAGIGLSKIW